MNWPKDADGDVFRRLESNDFDFSLDYEIDFNIDFDHWPLSQNECAWVLQHYPNAEIIDPDEEAIEDGIEIGYVRVTLVNKLSYDFVMEVQQQMTEQMADIGGFCESWGVAH